MGEQTAIAWCDDTFNPVWGCVKVSPACTNCYAEKWAKRTGFTNLWGPGSERRLFGDKHWNEPLTWNRWAAEANCRRRVFCGSMCDIFEPHPAVLGQLCRLWKLIDQAQNLDWLLLTKRPENIHNAPITDGARWPSNVWLGTTVESKA